MKEIFPLVTVFIPFKNPKLTYFKEALNSVISQTTSFWNLILIYDYDEDKQIEGILKNLNIFKDKKVVLLKNESNLITGALNTGMRYSKTPYVCSLHCDDFLAENAIDVLNNYITKYPFIDYFHSSRMHIDENGQPISTVIKARESFHLSDFKKYDTPVKHLHCWKVSSALAIGGMDESIGLHGADDYDFPWCMAEAGYSFMGIPECLYYYRDHREHYRLTTHVPLDAQIGELKKIWKKHNLVEEEIIEQIKIRTSGYLKQALYLNEEDKKMKEKENYNIRNGWRERNL